MKMKTVVKVDSARFILQVDTVKLLEEVFPVGVKLFQDYLKQDPRFIGNARKLVMAYLKKKANSKRGFDDVFADKLTGCFFDEQGKPRTRVEIIKALHELAESVRDGIRSEEKKGKKYEDIEIEELPLSNASEGDALLIALIDNAISSLTPQQEKVALMLAKEYEGVEMAAEMNLSKGRISQLTKEVRKKIKNSLPTGSL